MYSTLSGGSQQSPAATLSSKIKQLELQVKSSSGSLLAMNLGTCLIPPSPSALSTELRELTASFSQPSARQDNLQAYIGQDVVEIGGVTFESLRQTTAWVKVHLPSGAYFDFNNAITLLDALGSVHLSNKDFMEEKYHASRGKFDNETAASFSRNYLEFLDVLNHHQTFNRLPLIRFLLLKNMATSTRQSHILVSSNESTTR